MEKNTYLFSYSNVSQNLTFEDNFARKIHLERADVPYKRILTQNERSLMKADLSELRH